jgi:mono/diheme cytochrome c family protein
MLRNLLALAGLVAIAAGIYAFVNISMGAYDVGADSGRGVVDRIAQYTRRHSIRSRKTDVNVPSLENPVVIAEGAARYSRMCAGCHLGPGVKDNEMRAGLNPPPPVLARRKHPAPDADFWVIDHGIKMSAMPAWGITHTDANLWAVVAFLQKLPSMNAARYDMLVAQGRSALASDGKTPGAHRPAGLVPQTPVHALSGPD